MPATIGAFLGLLGRGAFGVAKAAVTGGVPAQMAVGGAIGFAGAESETLGGRIDAGIRGAVIGGAIGGGARFLGAAGRAGFGIDKLRRAQQLRRSPVFTGPRMEGGSFYTPRGPTMGAPRPVGEPVNYREILAQSPAARIARGTGAAAGLAGRGLTAALERPGLTLATVGGLAGAMALGGSAGDYGSPTMEGAKVDVKYNQQALAANELMMGGVAPMGFVGTAPQMQGRMHRAMQQSTQGLVQGLHRGRH